MQQILQKTCTKKQVDFYTYSQDLEIITDEKNTIIGAKTTSGAVYNCKAIIICSGTYLNARCLTGEMITYSGPNGLQAATHLTNSLIEHGVEMYRFKTGTPARIDKRSIDFSKMEEQFGDERVVPFSFTTNPEDVQIEQASCWLTYTNETKSSSCKPCDSSCTSCNRKTGECTGEDCASKI